MPNNDNLVTTAELCDLLKITRQAVYKWRQKGMPTAINIKGGTIRYNIPEVMEWLQAEGVRRG